MKDNQGISERKLIDRLVPDPNWGAMQGLIATSFELRPDFLEMDFLPSVFGLGAWDDRSWATRIALEKRLFELDAAVILTESRRYRGRPRSLRLEFCPVVSPRGSVLHAKITVLLFEHAVRLVVGSANLTKQGYRENREIVAVLTASSRSKKEASLIMQGLTGMEVALGGSLKDDAHKLIRRAIETLKPWLNGGADPDTAFLWSNGQTRLWSEFISRWPQGESIKRVSLISPFWSQDASLTLTAFLGQLRKVGSLAPDAELRLLTDAFENPNGDFIPVLPLGYASQNWSALGVRATAQPVSPKVHPEELGGMEGFTGTRALHAKVVLIEGTRTGLAYLGSANFTGHGWGFIPGEGNANTEAGLILRRPLLNQIFDSLLPDLVGNSVLLSDANAHILQPPEINPADEPWPEFIQQVVLAPVAGHDDQLELRFDVAPMSASLLWQARLLDKDGTTGETIVSLERTKDSAEAKITVALTAQVLTRLLTDQEVLIAWSACAAGRPFPLNVEPSARNSLPISPGKECIGENQLLSYYQGRIAWEQLFPEPDSGASAGQNPALAAPIDTGVDKSRIQSYQIREFVEALTGLRQDLQKASQSEQSMRLALLGPVSPVTLAQTILDAINAGRRTPTAAAFQLVEILACLNSVRAQPVADRLSAAWKLHLDHSTERISRLLEQVVSAHAEAFAANKAFSRYQKTVLNGEPASPP
jgi:phosphatidylserine/phosphatidylglycerophosphate/cardiolipin synthase-like enzyme